nr:MAG TPA: hypothetical protein [Caudoviricetes sp.]
MALVLEVTTNPGWRRYHRRHPDTQPSPHK